MTKFQKMFYDIKNTRDYKTIGEDIDYKVWVEHENRKIIMQFEESKGTDKKHFWHSDWFHNLAFIPWILWLDKVPVLTTFGYACAYKSAKNQPIDELCSMIELHPDYAVEMRAWSFGTAMIKIAVRHYWIRRHRAIDNKYGYGDVKVWYNPFMHWIAKKYVKYENFEFVTPNDFVTWCVPFCHRTNKCSVGRKFALKEIFKTEWYHTHYEEYDYSKYEYTDFD